MTAGADFPRAGLLARLTTSAPQALPENLQELVDEAASLRQRVVVLRQVVAEGEESALELAKERFAEGETQFLLENYEGSEALLREALWVPEFHEDPDYAMALYYFAESLMNTGGWLEAQRSFVAAASLLSPGRLRQNVLGRLLELAQHKGLRGFNQQFDDFYREEVRAVEVRPELSFRYAQWLASREDLPLQRAHLLAHRELSRLGSTPFAHRANYVRGVLFVELGDFERARELFEGLVSLRQHSKDLEPRKRHLIDLAELGLARIFHHQEDYETALSHYENITPDSPEYADALFEKADSLVRLERLDEALATSELLRRALSGELSAQAGLFEARLLLQLGFHDRAIAVFAQVVEELLPDRNQVEEILTQDDPIAFFEALLEQKDPEELGNLLPERVRSVVDTAQDVEAARQTTDDLRRVRRDVELSRNLVLNMQERLEKGGLELFPELQESDAHAIQLSNACARLEHRLVLFQLQVLSAVLTEDERQQLDELAEQSAELNKRFMQLPKSREELAARRERFGRRLGELERSKAAVNRQLYELEAELQALQQSLESRVQGEHDSEEFEAEQRELEHSLSQFRRLIDQLRRVQEGLSTQLAQQRMLIPSLASGGQIEEELRAAYRQQIVAMQRIIAQAGTRISRRERPLLVQTQSERTALDRMQQDIASVRSQLASRAQAQAEIFRERVALEAQRLELEAARLAVLESHSSQLLGEAALGSFQRAGQFLNDLVMQAEVGIIDVAWEAKEETGRQASELVNHREQALREHREQFREVLSHAE